MSRFALLLRSRGIVSRRIFQPPLDKFDIALRRLDALLRLLLERMQDVDGRLKPNRINGPKSISVKIINHFDDTASKTLEQLGRRRMLARLRQEQLEAEIFLHLRRKLPVVLAA